MAEAGFSSELRRPATADGPEASRAGAADVALLPASEAARLVGPWADLADRAVEGNAFLTPGFLLAGMAHLGGGAEIAAARDGRGTLIALAPVTRSRLGRIAPAVQVWTNPYAPLGTPLVDLAAIEAAVAGLVEGVAGSASLVIPDLALDGLVAVALRAHAGKSGRPITVLDQRQRAILTRADGPENLRSSLVTKKRKELGRQMRRMADLGAVTVETVSDAAAVASAFEEFLALEATGWKGAKGTALVSVPATAAFSRAAVRDLALAGGVRISSIRLDRKPVAMLTSFVSGSTGFTWKIAYDEAFARFSPGAQLMLEAGQALLAEPEIAVIDSCAAANHPMIDHLWRERRTVGTLVLGPPGGGTLHRLGLAALQAETEARHVAKRLKARLKH